MQLILLGYMGSGKTTISKLLADKLEIKAIDLQQQDTLTGVFRENKRPIAGYQTVSENSIESLALHLALKLCQLRTGNWVAQISGSMTT